MKIVVDTKKLASVLANAMKAVANRSPKPAFQCVLLQARTPQEERPGLTVWASNGEVWVRQTLEQVEVSQPGDSLVFGAKLNEIVKSSIDGTLAMKTDGAVLRVTGSDSKFGVNGADVASFPLPDPVGEEAQAAVGGDVLARLLAQTLFCTSAETNRYAINGVQLEWGGQNILAVATDGHRMAKSDGTLSVAMEGKSVAIVPTQALSIVSSLIDSEGGVFLSDNGSRVSFRGEGFEVYSSLVEGQFPPYKEVIPRNLSLRTSAMVDSLRSAVRRAALMTSPESKGVRFAFRADGQLDVSARVPESGEAEIAMQLGDAPAKALEIGFQPSYVLDGLNAILGKSVDIGMNAPNKPIVVSEPGFLYVLMPVNLS